VLLITGTSSSKSAVSTAGVWHGRSSGYSDSRHGYCWGTIPQALWFQTGLSFSKAVYPCSAWV